MVLTPTPKICSCNAGLGCQSTRHTATRRPISSLSYARSTRHSKFSSHRTIHQFLADRTNGRAIGTVLRLSSSVVCTECIVAKRCILEQKLLWIAYKKSYVRNRLVPKWMTLTFV